MEVFLLAFIAFYALKIQNIFVVFRTILRYLRTIISLLVRP